MYFGNAAGMRIGVNRNPETVMIREIITIPFLILLVDVAVESCGSIYLNAIVEKTVSIPNICRDKL